MKGKCASMECPEPNKTQEITNFNVCKGFGGRDKGVAMLCRVCNCMADRDWPIRFNKDRIKERSQ